MRTTKQLINEMSKSQGQSSQEITKDLAQEKKRAMPFSARSRGNNMQFNNDSNKRLPCADNPVKLGNVYGDYVGNDFAGNVWGKDGISPTLASMSGGGRQPMVIVNDKNQSKQ